MKEVQSARYKEHGLAVEHEAAIRHVMALLRLFTDDARLQKFEQRNDHVTLLYCI
jgi:hypothetical protein